MTKRTTERAKRYMLEAAARTDKQTMRVMLEYMTVLQKTFLDVMEYGRTTSDIWIELHKKAEEITKLGEADNVRVLITELEYITINLLHEQNYKADDEEGKIIDLPTK